MKKTRCRIIPLSRKHLDACKKIIADSEPWKTLGTGIDFTPALTRGNSSLSAYVCMQNASVSGFILFSPDPVFAQGGYLRAIGVAPDARRTGIGKEMLHFAEEATQRRAANIYLCVSSFNRGALAFYRSLGYEKVGTLNGLLKAGVSEYIYWKRLKRGIGVRNLKGTRTRE